MLVSLGRQWGVVPCRFNVRCARASVSEDPGDVRFWSARFCRRSACGLSGAWNAATVSYVGACERMCLWDKRELPTGRTCRGPRRAGRTCWAEKRRAFISTSASWTSSWLNFRENQFLEFANARFVALVEGPLFDPLAADQSRLHQNLQMLACGGLAYVQLPGDR